MEYLTEISLLWSWDVGDSLVQDTASTEYIC